jgi:hypothetical protein
MNIVTQEEDKPQPFADLLDLVSEYGMYEVLESLTNMAEFESKDSECENCKELNKHLHAGLRAVVATVFEAE